MSVLVLADLHLDMWLEAGIDPFLWLAHGQYDVFDGLIIAGDLSNKPKVRWPHMLAHLKRYMPAEKIYILPGNHDYYDHVLDGDDRLAAICADAGVHFAQKSEFFIGGLRFLCATLWTDFQLDEAPEYAMEVVGRQMNDYRYIRLASEGYRKIRPADTVRVHADHRAWLESRLAEAYDGPTVVVTHHCPLPELISEGPRDEMDFAYGSDLEPVMTKYKPESWLFGHTHLQNKGFGGVRTLVQNVSVGYPDQIHPDNLMGCVIRSLRALPLPRKP
ncbi:Calcineurin-like phosphoesterase [Gemmobacter megaterium]|uniref:Calcineurin-like phosphoesterase n=1 Tax=Gemmobacter megaterium TaxID=1086013 RepID=A0A1N7L3M9_9RHOB|nr:metallophosphoesterase [Gemmobacter megaterium]GGE05436.1 metallophosphoesterase [Gemmobacter megaterium]SIS68475.1 Calcineurin-like phosphoesterase [Gemmobacter megaterium]